MKKLEVFFDYNCPYCLKGHEQLLEILPDHPGLEVVWHPCEISVFKKEQGKATDVCQQALFFAIDSKIDLWGFHKKVYEMIFVDKVNTADVDVLVNGLKDLLDAEALRQALKDGKYIKNVNAANKFAFDDTGVHVVPTYRADGGVLKDRQEFYNMGPTNTGYGGKK